MHLTQLKIYENVNKTFVSISEYIKSHSTEKENEQMKVEKKDILIILLLTLCYVKNQTGANLRPKIKFSFQLFSKVF